MLTQLKKPAPALPNRTGIPAAMKTRFERAAGFRLDDVRVHYNAETPSRFNTDAYALGSHVYLAPGRHALLPHELGHVLQYKTRALPVTGAENDVPVCVRPAVERQADEYSACALRGAPLSLRPAATVGPPRLMMARTTAFQVFQAEMRRLRDAGNLPGYTGTGFAAFAQYCGQVWRTLSPDQKDRYAELASQLNAACSKPPERKRSNRYRYMGKTPRKVDPVGQQVIARMVADESDADDTVLFPDLSRPGDTLLLTGYDPQNVYSLTDPEDATHLDMGHLYDAVTFWNEIGRYTGEQSACVRAFMEDPNNYRIQFGRRNCATAPHTGYLPVADRIDPNFAYIPCARVGDASNFHAMIGKLRRQGLRP